MAPGQDTQPRSVAQAFLRSVQRFGPREAIKPLGAPAVSYRQLAEEVRKTVAGLRAMGVGRHDTLAVCLPNGLPWVVLTYAAAFLGARLAPINIRYRPDELRYVLQASAATLLFTQQGFLSNAFIDRLRDIAGAPPGEGPLGVGTRAHIAALPALRHIVMVDDADVPGTLPYRTLAAHEPAGIDLEHMAAQLDGSEPFWLFWTSGTTSRPKGALLPQSAIGIVWQWTRLAGYDSADRVLMTRPLFYIAGHYWCFLGPLLHGACAVVGQRFSPDEIQALCREERITVLSGNPLLLKSLVESPGFDPGAFDTVRLGYFSGSALPLPDMRRIHRAIGYKRLIHTYGMTELGGFTLSTLLDDTLDTACASCGLPFGDLELKIADPETGRPVTDGQAGMLMSRGHPLLGYINLPEDEQRAFYDDEGWYKTGDLMRKTPEGRYQFLGRAKDLIKVNGENVSAGEIETVLMSHPDISLASVIGLPDERRGEVPIAYLQASAGAAPPEIERWCRDRMAPYKVPARFIWLGQADWPMTATGKIQKDELRLRLLPSGPHTK